MGSWRALVQVPWLVLVDISIVVIHLPTPVAKVTDAFLGVPAILLCIAQLEYSRSKVVASFGQFCLALDLKFSACSTSR